MTTDNAIEQIKHAVMQTAINFGHSQSVAGDLAQAVAHKIMKAIGGSPYYIPKKAIYERNEKIKADWNGKNTADLLKEYAISKSTLHRILKKRGES